MTSDLVRTWDNWHRENDKPTREKWQHWLRMHGIDPDEVSSSPAKILRRPDRYQIAYEAYVVTHKDGRRMSIETAKDDQGDVHPVKVSRIFQMEASPLPFPV